MEDSVVGVCGQVAEVGVLLADLLTRVGAAEGLDGCAPPAARFDDRLRTLVVGLEQIRNATEAAQAAAMAAMGREARALDAIERATDGRPTRSHEEFVPDEIAALLGCTKMAAHLRYGVARQVEQYDAVDRAWRAGALDARKATTICEQADLLTGQHADDLAAAAVTYATEPGRSRTAPQLREWLRRRVIAADPDAAENRRRRALADRRVVITPGDDGMSELWALLPAVSARQIQQTLTGAAQHLGADDTRTMDQRRADTLVDLLLGHGEPTHVQLQVLVPADTLAGTNNQPGWIPGLGPITAQTARELIGENTPRPQLTVQHLLTDPTTGTLTALTGLTELTELTEQLTELTELTELADLPESRYRPSPTLDRAVRARDLTCRFPGCRRTADPATTDLDHTTPWPQGSTTAPNLAVLCRRHHRLKHQTHWHVRLTRNGTMTWTTPTGHTITTHPWHYTDPSPT